MAQAALSNMVGGVGYFHGRTVIKGDDGRQTEVKGGRASGSGDHHAWWRGGGEAIAVCTSYG